MTPASADGPSAGGLDEPDLPHEHTLQWCEPWALEQGEARVRSLFASTFSADPDCVESSPGLVTLVGEHTDYSGGLSLSTITPHRAYVAASVRSDRRIRIVSAQAHEVDGPKELWEGDLTAIDSTPHTGWVRYVTGVLWALGEHGYPTSGIDIAIDSCVPMGAGLGSSAALQCAVALAADSCLGLALNTSEGRIELAEIALDAEARYVGVPGGGLGHHTSLRCATGEGLLLDFQTQPVHTTHLTLQFPNYGLCQLVIDTHTPHGPQDVSLAEHRQGCERAAAALGAANLREVANAPDWFRRVNHLEDPLLRAYARHVVTEIHRVRLVLAELAGTNPAHERFVDIGKALYRSHFSLDTDFGVSTEALNLAVNTAFSAGALGARLVGAGLGGSAIAMVRKDQADATAQLIDQAFVQHGLTRPTFFVV